ncbi:hypothetical protein CMO86_09070 [Candidatus Woesearchaeota archaeon]|jgi:hypothetical protein|nr:hypothetical protein [Candidatus Woesearchaeota archaeon]|tara:strand:- start:78 stop:272 length:195 start_codon:yes stop_codon:yes gene_type:complete
MIKVKGHSNLYRDEETGAIINSDVTGYNQYVNSIETKNLRRKELDEMKKDIDEIKSLLREILNK